MKLNGIKIKLKDNMAILKVIDNKNKYIKEATIKHLMCNYLTSGEKTTNMIFSGINLETDDPKMQFWEMKMLNDSFKYKRFKGRKERLIKHYVISYDHDESKKLGADIIHKINKQIIESIPEFKDYQISLTTHEDREHIHTHIVVNTTNIKNGSKLHLEKNFLYEFIKQKNRICLSYGLDIPNRKLDLKAINNQEIYRAKENGKIEEYEKYKYIKEFLYIAEKTTNKKQFIEELNKRGYKCYWGKDYVDKNGIEHIGVINIFKNKLDNNGNEVKNSNNKNIRSINFNLNRLARDYGLLFHNNNDLTSHFNKIDNINKEKFDLSESEKYYLKDEFKFNEKISQIIYDFEKELTKDNIDSEYKIDYKKLDIVQKNKLRNIVLKILNENKEINDLYILKLKKYEELKNQKSPIVENFYNQVEKMILNQLEIDVKRKDITKTHQIKLGIKNIITNLFTETDNIASKNSNNSLMDLETKRKQEKDNENAIKY